MGWMEAPIVGLSAEGTEEAIVLKLMVDGLGDVGRVQVVELAFNYQRVRIWCQL